ncbi:MAG: SurA N-terminal domain-containing protein [Polyangiaceae bacterium]|nr:SurA N-terminal domain-containing protein [Polyangiaceae bacterium]
MRRRADVALLIGALAGAAVATAGIVRAPRAAMPADAVAMVGDTPIRRAELEAALAGVETEGKGTPLEPALRRHVLERLIDEELLVQAALELGLARQDRRARAELSGAALAFLRDAPGPEPTEGELRAFFEAHRGYFATEPRLEVEERYFSDAAAGGAAAARERAVAARDAWRRGEPAPGDAPPLPVPAGPLPLTKLEQYLGPAAVRSVVDQPLGIPGEPLRATDGWRVVRLGRRHDGAASPFEVARGEVALEWRRREGEARLRAFLAARRERTPIRLAQELGR